MSFGLMVTADFFTSDQLKQLAQSAERAGFSNLWVPEMFGRDPFITCATLLSSTQTIHVGTAITNVYARDERAIKAAAYSLAECSGHRFELGLGVSNKVGNDQRGLPWLAPVKKLRSFLDRYETTELMFDHGGKKGTNVPRCTWSEIDANCCRMHGRRVCLYDATRVFKAV